MDNEIQQLKEQLKDLEDRIRTLEGKRIFQQDLVPDVVKMRHVGEGVRFIRSGLVSKLPTAEKPMQGSALYWATDTNTLYIYNGTAWVLIPLTSAISTGWAVTNKTEDKTLDCNVNDALVLGDVLGTLIDTLVAQGILSA